MYYASSVDNVYGNDDDVVVLMAMVVEMRKRRELAVAWLLEEKS